MLFKSVDKKLEELGFIKKRTDSFEWEDEYGVTYVRNRPDGVQRIDIIRYGDGGHTITSTDDLGHVVELTSKERKLIMKKYHEMIRRYGWL